MDYEYAILQKERACLFNLPAMTSAKGHYLDTWKDMIWEGIVKVTAQNKSLKIYFTNQDKSVFAMTPVPPKYEEAIQKCVDSSRGFAVRLQHSSGKFAWVGLAFRDRNDAFDFNVCFSDFEKQLDREVNPQKYASEFAATKDFSLKPGEKISFNIAGEANEGQSKPKPKATNTDFKIAPPPGLKVPATTQQAVSKPPTQNNKNNNDWGNFADFGNNNSQGAGSQGNSGFAAFEDSWAKPTNNTSTWDAGFSNQGFGAGASTGVGFGAGAPVGFGGGGSAGVGFGAASSGSMGFGGNQNQQGFSGWQNPQSLPSQTQQAFGFGSQSNQINNQPPSQVSSGGQSLPNQQQPKKTVETNLLDLL